jgi:8-amino-7-oxononanoate synthase
MDGARTPTWVSDELAGLDKADARRRLITIDSPIGGRVETGGRELLNFSSNDYLGLASHPEVRRAAADAALKWGAGAGASRLITGTLAIHAQLEGRLAKLKGAEAAVLFSTGYQANIGILQALASTGVVYSDELNHASIVDGCRLAGARTVVFRHSDMDDLEQKLAADTDEPRKLIVTDGVFSMDGDIAKLDEIVELAERYDAIVVVDEAHATGVIGEGRGTAHHFGLDGRVHVHMGTFGKALGGFGAFAASSKEIVALLINRARTLIYTTAPPPPSVGAIFAALDIIEREPQRIERLAAHSRQLREGLAALGFEVPSTGAQNAPTPIVPVILGSNTRTLAWAAALRERGFWVHPIRPPTVAEGTSRLRITVTSDHTTGEIDQLLAAFKELLSKEMSEGDQR